MQDAARTTCLDPASADERCGLSLYDSGLCLDADGHVCADETAVVSALESDSGDPPAPRSVLRGANDQTINIDWFRAVGPSCEAERITAKFDELFGPADYGPGRFGLRMGRHWPGGAMLALDIGGDGKQAAPHCVVELPGSFLAPMTLDERLGIMRFLLASDDWKCTRLDIANDYHGSGITIIPDLIASCMRGELSGAKVFEPHQKYRMEHGQPELAMDMVTFGTRGKNGSGRYVRCYDKGLESKKNPRGEWIRWEAEFSKAVAQAVAVAILEADHFVQVARGYALGCVDFRLANGKRKRDRPVLAWWLDVLGDTVPMRQTMPRRTPDAESWAQWMRTAVLPSLHVFSDALDLDVADFIELLGPKQDRDWKKLLSPAGWQIFKFGCGVANRKAFAGGEAA